jgi:signal transduction histidine kinase
MNEASGQRWPEILADLAMGVMLLDFNERRLLWQNRAMQELFAVPPAGCAQAADFFLGEFPAGPPGESARRSVELQGRSIGFTVHHGRDGLGLVLATDISEEARRRQAAETASQMDALDYLFFTLAHEIGNPINSIKMTLDVLINNFSSYSPETQLEYLNSVHAEFSRLEELLKAIRSFNVFEHLDVQAIDVQALVRNLLQMLKSEIGEKGIALTISLPEKPLWAACDPRALQQSLLNVISNAIDAVAGRAGPALGVAVAHDGERCRIRIADNGCGIPAEKEREVFLPFCSSKPRGAGLGLTMAKKLLTRMNGTIQLNPLQPQGTEALLTLPLASPHGA